MSVSCSFLRKKAACIDSGGRKVSDEARGPGGQSLVDYGARSLSHNLRVKNVTGALEMEE